MYKNNIGSMAGFYEQGAQEMEQEGLQTLYLMNPAYSGYGDAPSTANFFLLNSAAAAVAPSLNLVSHHPAGSPAANSNIQQFLGIPLHPSGSDHNNEISSLQAYSSNLNHSLWGSSAPPLPFGLRQPQQGLSLSLSPHQRVSVVSNGVSDIQSFWVGSKYLKVAQQLLDEVVTVGNGVRDESTKAKASESKTPARSTKETEFGRNEKSGELTTAERQDLQMKNVKLVNMLEEVEHRYKQYHHHMETVISSFESAIGSGAARTYTSLALQTISKQFRCLKDAILAQIRAIAKSLGEEGSLGEERSSSGSRLRFIDHQLRQQRAFQQIGMIQHNAWRPQRGLPERSVSILRAWLFEHFLHPYPKDSDKQTLAKQTGLTRSQVSNWFINARVRLWKPMVEEMYLEELKGEQHNNGEEHSSKRNANGESTSISSANKDIISPTKTDRTNHHHHPHPPAFSLPHSTDPEYTQSPNPKRVRTNESKSMDFGHINRDDNELMMKFGEETERSHGYSWISSKINNGDAGLSSFSGEFTPRIMNKSVSLTLGLPHGDSRGHNIQLGRRVELNGNNNEYCGLNNQPSVLLPSTFEDINVQGRKRFAAAQLLPDFVA